MEKVEKLSQLQKRIEFLKDANKKHDNLMNMQIWSIQENYKLNRDQIIDLILNDSDGQKLFKMQEAAINQYLDDLKKNVSQNSNKRSCPSSNSIFTNLSLNSQPSNVSDYNDKSEESFTDSDLQSLSQIEANACNKKLKFDQSIENYPTDKAL